MTAFEKFEPVSLALPNDRYGPVATKKLVPAPNFSGTLFAMNWHQAIETNQKALASIVTGLLRRVVVKSTPPQTPPADTTPSGTAASDTAASDTGLPPTTTAPSPADTPNPRPRQEGVTTVRQLPSALRLNAILRTAEAALRRLIMLFIHVNGITAKVYPRPSNNRPLPDFSSLKKNENALPRFNVIDPRNPLIMTVVDDEVDAHGALTHSVGSILPSDSRLVSEQASPRKQQPNFNPEKLLARLQALDHALHTLPQQARRMAREIEKRKNAAPDPNCIPPIRIGKPPGHRDRPEHEIDHVLKECHGLLKDVIASPP